MIQDLQVTQSNPTGEQFGLFTGFPEGRPEIGALQWESPF